MNVCTLVVEINTVLCVCVLFIRCGGESCMSYQTLVFFYKDKVPIIYGQFDW